MHDDDAHEFARDLATILARLIAAAGRSPSDDTSETPAASPADPPDEVPPASPVRPMHRTRRGDSHPQARLSEAKVRVARRLVASGARRADVATLCDVSTATITDAVRGRTWSHLDGGRP